MKTTKIQQIQNNLIENFPFRQAESRWAGGENFITAKWANSKKANATGWSEQAWSRNGIWSGNNGRFKFRFSRRAIKYFPTGFAPGGEVVLDAKKIAPREYRVKIAKQGRGLEINTVSGFLIRGYFIQIKNIEKARKMVARHRALAAKDLIKARKTRKPIPHRLFVGIEDSLKSGNCPHGTEQFAARLRREFGDIGGIRADVLINFQDDMFTRRAVMAASNR